MIANTPIGSSNNKFRFPTSLLMYLLFHVSLLIGMIHQFPQLKHPSILKTQLFWCITFVSIILTLILYLKNPGYLYSQQAKISNGLQQQKEAELSPQNPLEIVQNIIDTIPNNNFQKRFCRLCNNSQPFRAKHCHDCERCVLTFDHHCFLLSNCIGQKNRHLFYLFILIEISQFMFSLSIILNKIQLIHPDIILLAILGGICIGLALCFMLLVFHTYLMLKGITTWEYFSWQYISYLTGFEKNKSPFSKGICYNIGVYWSTGCKRSNHDWAHQCNPSQ